MFKFKPPRLDIRSFSVGAREELSVGVSGALLLPFVYEGSCCRQHASRELPERREEFGVLGQSRSGRPVSRSRLIFCDPSPTSATYELAASHPTRTSSRPISPPASSQTPPNGNQPSPVHVLFRIGTMGLADKLGIGRSSTFIATVHVHELLQGAPRHMAASLRPN